MQNPNYEYNKPSWGALESLHLEYQSSGDLSTSFPMDRVVDRVRDGPDIDARELQQGPIKKRKVAAETAEDAENCGNALTIKKKKPKLRIRIDLRNGAPNATTAPAPMVRQDDPSDSTVTGGSDTEESSQEQESTSMEQLMNEQVEPQEVEPRDDPTDVSKTVFESVPDAPATATTEMEESSVPLVSDKEPKSALETSNADPLSPLVGHKQSSPTSFSLDATAKESFSLDAAAKESFSLDAANKTPEAGTFAKETESLSIQVEEPELPWVPLFTDEEISRAVLVHGFSEHSAYESVHDFFCQSGLEEIEAIRLEIHPDTGASGIVVFGDEAFRAKALELNGTLWKDGPVSVEPAVASSTERSVFFKGTPAKCNMLRVYDLFRQRELVDIKNIELPQWLESWGMIEFATVTSKEKALRLMDLSFDGHPIGLRPAEKTGFLWEAETGSLKPEEDEDDNVGQEPAPTEGIMYEEQVDEDDVFVSYDVLASDDEAKPEESVVKRLEPEMVASVPIDRLASGLACREFDHSLVEEDTKLNVQADQVVSAPLIKSEENAQAELCESSHDLYQAVPSEPCRPYDVHQAAASTLSSVGEDAFEWIAPSVTWSEKWKTSPDRTAYVKGMPVYTTAGHILAFFKNSGIEDVVYVKANTRDAPELRCPYAHVQFSNAEALQRAMDLSGERFLDTNYQLSVSPARQSKNVRTIFVRGFRDCTQELLRRFFSEHGIEGIECIRLRPTSGHVTFDTVEDTKKSLGLSGLFTDFGTIYIEPAIPYDPKDKELMHRTGQLTGTDFVLPPEGSFAVSIRGVPFTCCAADVRGFFEEEGIVDIAGMYLPTYRNTGRLRGHGYVAFESYRSYEKARALDHKYLMNRYIEIMRFDTATFLSWDEGPKQSPALRESSSTILIRNLPHNATSADIRCALENTTSGSVGDIRIVSRDRGVKIGFADVSEHMAATVVDKFGSIAILGVPCRVAYDRARGFWNNK